MMSRPKLPSNTAIWRDVWPLTRVSALRLTLTISLAVAELGCSSGAVGNLQLLGVPTTAAAGETLELQVQLQGVEVRTTVTIEVLAGGGSVSTTRLPFIEGGTQTLRWTLGIAPVSQRLRIFIRNPGESAQAEAEFSVDATRKTALQADDFGDIDAALTIVKVEGTTEDLAFTPSGNAIVMGYVGGLLKVSVAGKTSLLPTTGDAIVQALGVAYDASGRLWICDSKGKALRRMSTTGVVSTIVDTLVNTIDDNNAGSPLGAPNHLAVLLNGDVIFSDPCLGKILWVDGTSGKVKATHTFDLANEGGPNGLALSPDGRTLMIATENTALLCNHTAKLALDKNVAGLFRLPINAGKFGKRDTIQAGLGLFGDGLAFDMEGNLYVVVDRVKDFKLQESAIEVLPKGGMKLRPFLTAKDRIFANVMFGSDAFGATRLYIALLSVPPFTGQDKRGLMRVDVGIAGLPLGHARSATK